MLILFGLRIASDIPIPWAFQGTPGVPDVEIRVGVAAGDGGPGFAFDIPEVGHYRIEGGRRITIVPEPGASEDALRLYLTGSAFGVLLHQRGLTVLHANSIELGGKAFLFMGPSGAGKSTLAGWFAREGLPVLADDVSAIDWTDAGTPVALPGLARLRLDPQTAQRLGLAGPSSACTASGKLELAFTPMWPLPVPIGGLYLLTDDAPPDALTVTPLTGIDALEMLMANTYRGLILHALGQSGEHLAASMRLARSAQCFVAARSKDWSHVDVVGQALLAHMHGVAGNWPDDA